MIKKFTHFIFVTTFIMTLALSLSWGIFAINKHYQEGIHELKEQGHAKLENQVAQIKENIEVIRSYSTSLANCLMDERSYDKERFSKLLKNFFIKEVGVYQLRLLDAKGYERLRYELDRNGNIIENRNLQDKSSRYYFQEATHLPINGIYLSKLDLNMENGKIETPYRQTLRTVEKVMIAQKIYYVVFNYDVSKLFKRALTTTYYDLFLVEKDGQINIHLNNNFAFSSQQQKALYWHDFIDTKEAFISQKPLDILPYDIIISLKKSLFTKLQTKKRDAIVQIILNAFLLSLFLAFLLYYFLRKHLGQLSKNILKIMKGKKATDKKQFQEFQDILAKISKQQKLIQKHIVALDSLKNSLEEKVKIQVEEIKEKQQQLLHKSRLAQMGEMISMIAHQWRQPLTAITATTGNLQLKLMMDEIDKETFTKEIGLVEGYAQHLSKTIDDFRNFFKTNKEKEKSSLDTIVTSTLEIVQVSANNKNITIKTTLQSPELFYTYASEVKQVLLNLIKNAEDALIEAKVKEPTIMIETFTHEDSYHLIVKDNAGGIPADIIKKIFDPYFSTKKEKDGTGLGLYMSKTIIQEHCHGTIMIENDNQGACFHITLKGER